MTVSQAELAAFEMPLPMELAVLEMPDPIFANALIDVDGVTKQVEVEVAFRKI